MTIEVNSNFPVQTLRLVVAGELQEVDSSEYLADKKVMLVGVPGCLYTYLSCVTFTRLHRASF